MKKLKNLEKDKFNLKIYYLIEFYILLMKRPPNKFYQNDKHTS